MKTEPRKKKRQRHSYDEWSGYGGVLRNTRKGRRGPRPLAFRHSMHIVLRSGQARGAWSFYRFKKKIVAIVEKFATKNRVKVHGYAVVGNHIHLHVKLKNRACYRPFIRAASAAIMMTVTGASRWNKPQLDGPFWTHRPFTRIVLGEQQFANTEEYILINQLEACGHPRNIARYIVKKTRAG